MSNSEQKEPVVFVPPSQVSPEELMKALQEDGVIEKPAVEKAAEITEKVAKTEKTEAPTAPKEELPALVRIAKEREAFRREMESAKPHLEALKAIPSHTVSAIAKAIASGDPVSLLAAAGMTHAQYNARLLGAKDPVKEETEEKSVNPEYDTLRQELAELRRERETEKVTAARSQVLTQMKDILKDDPKFETINSLGDFEGVERVLIDYHRAHGSLPGVDLKESVQLAAEQYELQLKKEAERWRPILTKGQTPAPVASKVTESPSAGTVTTRTLTNANTTAPAVPKTAPKTRQEIIDAIANGTEDQLLT